MYWNVQEYTGLVGIVYQTSKNSFQKVFTIPTVFWLRNVLECTGIYRNPPKSTILCQNTKNLLEYIGLYRNTQESTGILPDSTGIYQTLPESARINRYSPDFSTTGQNQTELHQNTLESGRLNRSLVTVWLGLAGVWWISPDSTRIY